MEHWSIQDYNNFKNKGTFKKSKYRANKTSVDGHTFDSQKEADYYCELKMRLQANSIQLSSFLAFCVTAPSISSLFYFLFCL